MLPAGTQFDVFRGTAAAKADETDDYPVGGGEGRERTRESSERYGVTRHPTIGMEISVSVSVSVWCDTTPHHRGGVARGGGSARAGVGAK